MWHRELSIHGAAFYAPEPQFAGRTTMAQVADWLADPAYRVDGLVTHTYDLSDWTTALNTADRGPGAGAVKVTLRPNPDLPLVGEPG